MISAISLLAFIFVGTSLALSFYLIYMMKFSWQKFIGDYHYRLRLLLCVCLILNRGAHLGYLVIVRKIGLAGESSSADLVFTEEMVSSNRETYSIAYNGFYLALLATYYIALILMLFLSIDRYERLNVVRRNMPIYWVFLFTKIASILWFCYLMIGYGIRHIGHFILRYGEYFGDPTMYSIFEHRVLVELSIIILGTLVYYGTTISLIFQCIFTDGFTGVIRIFQRMLAPSRQGDGQADQSLEEIEFSQVNTCSELDLTSNRQTKIARNRIRLALHMFCYLVCILLSDIFTGIFVTATMDSLLFYDDRVAIGLSWLAVHVALMFKLMDLLLQQLKTVRQVSDTNHHYGNNTKWYAGGKLGYLFAKTLKESYDTTDLVEDSLKSSTDFDQVTPISQYSVYMGVSKLRKSFNSSSSSANSVDTEIIFNHEESVIHTSMNGSTAVTSFGR